MCQGLGYRAKSSWVEVGDEGFGIHVSGLSIHDSLFLVKSIKRQKCGGTLWENSRMKATKSKEQYHDLLAQSVSIGEALRFRV